MPRSIRFNATSGRHSRNASFLLRAKTPVCAKAAMHAQRGFELSARNSLGCILHPVASCNQISLGTRRDDWNVVLEIVETQSPDFVSPLLFRRDRVERKLQTVVRAVLIASLAGLVVDDAHATVWTLIDAVNSPDHDSLSNSNLERFFGMQHPRRRKRS